MGFLDKLFGSQELEILAPVAGQVVPIQQVSDPTFGEEIVGKGVAIRPEEGRIVAPCNGKVELMFDTGHAVSMVSDFGAEILIHVGLDTVKLKGEHYTVHVKNGDAIKAGQLLIEFDRDAIAAAGYDTITPVVVCNPEAFASFQTYAGRPAAVGDKVIGLKK